MPEGRGLQPEIPLKYINHEKLSVLWNRRDAKIWQ
jgi:hypothetical protein